MSEDRFKFRAWNPPTKEMRNNFFIEADTGLGKLDNCKANEDVILFDDIIIMQCTGLKDKNGKLIFEGDILRARYEEDDDDDSYITVVKCDRGCLMIDVNESDYDYTSIGWASETYELEIIGNIYENP